jgi:hypothetical protein
MADQEVIKHTKKIQKIWVDKEHSFGHKVKEFFLEIFIIVFAVSLSIWLHGWSEHRHEQQEVKTFLLGLKKDIREDITESRNLVNNYQEYGHMYRYLYRLRRTTTPHPDSLHQYLVRLNSNAFLRPNDTRFNSFLSAGKVGRIENDSLALQILELYQEYIPRIRSSENGWTSMNDELNNYMMDHVRDIDSDQAQWEVLISPKGKYLCKALIPWPQLYERYNDFIQAGEKIIKQIDAMYPGEEK